MHVFVTGATGWIGSATVPELLAHGHTVTALARSDASAAAAEALGATVVRGSLDDLGTLADAARAADGVVHLGFKHEEMFGGRQEVAIAADRAVIGALGDALAGTGKPLIIASGCAGHPRGALITERDMPDVDAGGVSGRMQNERDVLALADRDVRSASVRLAPTVHGMGDPAFVASMVRVARETGVSGYVGAGENHWPAVHRDDAARLFRLAVESAPAGTVLHATAEPGVALREIAAALGDRYDLETRAVEPGHFGWLAHFAQMDVQASSARTRELLGWSPTEPTLLEDIRAGAYDG